MGAGGRVLLQLKVVVETVTEYKRFIFYIELVIYIEYDKVIRREL
jgi:hypothetical protein